MRDKRTPTDVCGEATVCSVGLFCCAVFFLYQYIFWLPTEPKYTSSTLIRGFCCVLNYLLTHLQICQQIKGFAFMFNLCLQQKPPGTILRRFGGQNLQRTLGIYYVTLSRYLCDKRSRYLYILLTCCVVKVQFKKSIVHKVG